MVSKADIADLNYLRKITEISEKLIFRISEDEVTYIDVEGLDESLIHRIVNFYAPMGWNITREICPPDYDELWFS
jgi:hypothetical protein